MWGAEISEEKQLCFVVLVQSCFHTQGEAKGEQRTRSAGSVSSHASPENTHLHTHLMSKGFVFIGPRSELGTFPRRSSEVQEEDGDRTEPAFFKEIYLWSQINAGSAV